MSKYEAKKFEPLKDEDKMPTGKHQGERMIDIPATYFMRLYDSDMCGIRVKDYIERNLDVIKAQAKQDGYGQ